MMFPELELWTAPEGRGLSSTLLFPLAPAFTPFASLQAAHPSLPVWILGPSPKDCVRTG